MKADSTIVVNKQKFTDNLKTIRESLLEVFNTLSYQEGKSIYFDLKECNWKSMVDDSNDFTFDEWITYL